MKTRAMLVGLIAGSFLLITTPSQAAAPAKAKSDRATVVVGATSTVNVLKNDKVGKRPSVKIIKHAKGVTAKVKGKKIVVKASKAGTYKLTYRVKSSRGSAKAVLTLKVKPKSITPPPPTPEVHPESLVGRLNALTVRAETDGGLAYDRNGYKHWNKGLNATDGCDARREVLIAEALVKPTVGKSCALTGGKWYSHYDGVTIENYTSTSLDMDHMIPLEEAHSSGAWAWSAERKEAFANDQGDARSLIGVTPSSNRSKGARDPGEWMPVNQAYRCTYLKDWVAVKTRWSLSVDATEKEAIAYSATACSDAKTAPITVTVMR